MCIAGEAVELRYDQGCLPHSAFGKRSRELWLVGALTAFHLDEFLDRFRTKAGEVGCNGGALSLNSETGAALPVGRDAEIRNEAVSHDLGPDPHYERRNRPFAHDQGQLARCLLSQIIPGPGLAVIMPRMSNRCLVSVRRPGIS